MLFPLAEALLLNYAEKYARCKVANVAAHTTRTPHSGGALNSQSRDRGSNHVATGRSLEHFVHLTLSSDMNQHLLITVWLNDS